MAQFCMALFLKQCELQLSRLYNLNVLVVLDLFAFYLMFSQIQIHKCNLYICPPAIYFMFGQIGQLWPTVPVVLSVSATSNMVNNWSWEQKLQKTNI